MKAVGANTQRGEFERHTKALAEGVSAINWLCVKPAPKDIVETALDGFQFLANKIRVEFKATNPDHVAFCDTGKAVFNGLVEYVKAHHKVGLKWNPMGGAAKDFVAGASPAPAAAAAAAPVTAAVAAAPAAAAAKPPGGPSNVDLFASLNKGLSVTGGLKKVTKDMKSSSLPPAAPVVAKAPAPKVNNNKPKGTAKCELAVGGKWQVDFQDGVCDVEITASKQMVYIYGCVGATINVKGKCKTITVDSCKKTNVHFDDVMASCEVVNSQRCHLRIANSCPALALDKVDGCTVFCSEAAKSNIEISCAKISEINMQWMDKDDELVEKPIPEQYVHRIKDEKITVDVSDLYSS
jgi:adenylyl cyclase-associated protein